MMSSGEGGSKVEMLTIEMLSQHTVSKRAIQYPVLCPSYSRPKCLLKYLIIRDGHKTYHEPGKSTNQAGLRFGS